MASVAASIQRIAVSNTLCDPRASRLRPAGRPSPSNLLRPSRRASSSRAVAVQPTQAFLKRGSAWWKAPKPANMGSVDSVQQLVDELEAHKHGLVVVEFYGTWCAGCKALAPRLVELAEGDPSVRWLTVDYDDNKALGRKLGVTNLPALLLFKGGEGCVAALEVSASRLSQLTDAIEQHSEPTPAEAPIQLPALPGFPTVRPRLPVPAQQPAAAAAAQPQPAETALQPPPAAASNVVEFPRQAAPVPASSS